MFYDTIVLTYSIQDHAGVSELAVGPMPPGVLKKWRLNTKANACYKFEQYFLGRNLDGMES